jgi:hypothetical protein
MEDFFSTVGKEKPPAESGAAFSARKNLYFCFSSLFCSAFCNFAVVFWGKGSGKGSGERGQKGVRKGSEKGVSQRKGSVLAFKQERGQSSHLSIDLDRAAK